MTLEPIKNRTLSSEPRDIMSNTPKSLQPTSGSGGNCYTTPVRPGLRRTSKKFIAPRSSGTSNKNSTTPKYQSPFSHPMSIQELKESIQSMKAEYGELAGKTAALKIEYNEGDLKQHMNTLHLYNEMKDVGQMLLGRLAESRGITSKDIYADFGLDLND